MNKKIKVLIFLLIASLVFVIGGCEKKEVQKEVEIVEEPKQTEGGNEMNLEQLNAPQAGEEIAVITTNHGEIKLRLFPEVAPKAVENFKTHAKDGYYNGVSFHRVMNNFMIQGGDPDGTGMGGKSIWGSPFEDEFSSNYRNVRGALSMANAGPGTNGSQFFIVHTEETPWLDGKHTVFGQVFEGMDVVDKIAGVDVGANDKPKEPVLMEKVEIIEYK